MSIFGAENLFNIFSALVEVVKPGPAIRQHVKLINNTNNVILASDRKNVRENHEATGIEIAGEPYQLYVPPQNEKGTHSESQDCIYNVTIIGFGKAVVGMASALVELLSMIPPNRNIPNKWKGILLVPKYSYKDELESHPWIEVIQGAEGNIPDHDAFQGATRIHQLVQEVQNSAEIIIAFRSIFIMHSHRQPYILLCISVTIHHDR